LDNHAMWNSLFITGTTLFAIGTIVAITATSYSVYLKKSTKNK
jgi:4-hydroxybenzoate polyprenyltransferase